MKDLVQCRKLEAKFRQLAVSDPTKRPLEAPLCATPQLEITTPRP